HAMWTDQRDDDLDRARDWSKPHCGRSSSHHATTGAAPNRSLAHRSRPADDQHLKGSNMIPLEDNFTDVISKAQQGLEISDAELAKKARVDASAIRKLRGGNFDELALFRVAPVLGLGARALSDLAQKEYRPSAREIDGLAVFNTPFHDMRVNAFLVWDAKSRKAIAFDTGADCRPMLDRIAKEKLIINLILLTHAHTDHIADLTRLKKETGAPVYISERESIPGAGEISEGHEFNV